MNLYQYHKLPIDALHQQCIDQVVAHVPSGVSYQMLSDVPSGCVVDDVDIRCQSDVIRCFILSNNPNNVWLDTDCRILNWWIPPADGKIYVDPAMSVIFDNGQTDVFVAFQAAYASKSFPHNPGWMQKLMRSNAYNKRFKLIPEKKFQHLSLSMAKHTNFASVTNDQCTIINNPDHSQTLVIRG